MLYLGDCGGITSEHWLTDLQEHHFHHRSMDRHKISSYKGKEIMKKNSLYSIHRAIFVGFFFASKYS